ncbi:VOC family protein [Salinimicrobium sp. HB62]|uniref:VOC family protein n=1 Tax=Salinimicrobium sp. HB62 TaxID=3077781 RepID=UPI002D785130|nr:VOC family protein [Salinimicrobium sp. HB62]
MKTFHVHVKVKDLEESISFYNALFNTKPTVVKADYAKWMLEDPRINYAISTGHAELGIEHLGLQTSSETELKEIYSNMKKAKGTVREEGNSTCCYSKSQKSWITDPQGVDWEAFYTYGTATVYGEGINAKPAPEVMEQWTGNDGKVGEKAGRFKESEKILKKSSSCSTSVCNKTPSRESL